MEFRLARACYSSGRLFYIAVCVEKLHSCSIYMRGKTDGNKATRVTVPADSLQRRRT